MVRSGGADLVGHITKRHVGKIAVAVVLGLVAAAAGLAQPVFIGKLIDTVALGGELVWPIVVVLALFAAEAVLTSLQAYAMGRVGESIVYRARTTLVARVLGADYRAFSRHRIGDLTSRIVADTAMLRVSLSQSLASIVVDATMVLGGLVLMFLIDPLLLGITLGCLAVASVVSLLLARRLKTVAARQRTIMGDFSADLQRAIGALATVKACGAEEFERERIGALASAARRSGIKVSALSALLSPAMGIGLQISLAIVIVTGMSRVATGTLSAASLTAFIMYLFYLVSPLVTLFMAIGQLQQGRGAVGRINELADIEQEVPVRAPLRAMETATVPGVQLDEVRYEGVDFFHDDTQALHGVSFVAPGRGLTAVVGPSGSGKTTLLQLLMRFYAVDAGRITLGGQDIDTIPLPVLRTLVGYVQQESPTLRGTIAENLRYGHVRASDSEIQRVLVLSGLEPVVRRLPKGLDTELGEGGAGLSGGERQRLAIARTLLRKPSVLLLDEATSNLDSESELLLRRSITEIAKECTVISVAHRLSTVVDADRIVVLDAGRVQAVGTHEALLRDSPLYRRLTAIQLGDPSGPDVPAQPGNPVSGSLCGSLPVGQGGS
ncbi:ABC transporter ATP-binding protein [Saccharomonospora glauca]|uniref:ABC-type multidrug transport system, ATPase and permease component n=1 Tax=Saccharomonospora glauca K62 TaxID=928724 RepID=I1D0Q8_9PSEU|nr:ABC transporter ATP-binding protein [Saccharomonospora glauca]EIE98532.1 ABC-type multidrug transport system, ATPase and permease component [Saccharomonospora glauca K62]